MPRSIWYFRLASLKWLLLGLVLCLSLFVVLRAVRAGSRTQDIVCDGICGTTDDAYCPDDCGLVIQGVCGDGTCDSGEEGWCTDDCGFVITGFCGEWQL